MWETVWTILKLIGVAIAYVVVIHLVKTGQEELAKRKEKDDTVTIDITDYKITEIPKLSAPDKPLFTYVPQEEVTEPEEPDIHIPIVKKKKGGFVSKELLKSYMSSQIGRKE